MTDPLAKGEGIALRSPGVGARPVQGADLQLVLAAALRVADLIAIAFIGILAYWLRNETLEFSERDLAALGIGVLLSVIYLHVARLYEGADIGRINQQVAKLAASWSAVIVTLVMIGYFSKTSATFSRIWIAT